MEKYELDNVLANLREYLESHQINTSRLFRCLNPHHIDGNASMKYFDDNRVYCFGCGANYNLVDVISVVEGVDNKEAFKRAISNYSYGTSKIPTKTIKQVNKKEKDYTNAYKIWNKNLKNNKQALDYLKKRGIEHYMIDRFNLGFNTFEFGENKFSSIIIPINENSFTARNINDNDEFRYYKPKGSRTELFNTQSMTNNRNYCVISEG